MKKQSLQFEPNKTILTIVVGFLVIYAVFSWNWALIVALAIGLLGIFSSGAARQISWFWAKLTWILSLIIPNILLSAIFFLILFPTALISRVFGQRDPIWLKNNRGSTFKQTDKQFNASSFENPW